MTAFSKFRVAIGGATLALGLFTIPAAAQEAGGDKVNQVILYGEDEVCPQPDDDTIVVCERRAEEERYRIPPNLRQSISPENESWTERAKSIEIADKFGVFKCSPSGAGGAIGCSLAEIEAAYAEREQGSDIRFAQLIADARAARTATIDAEAAETQARVELLERAYMERLERERDAPLAGETPADAEVVKEADMLPLDQRPPTFDEDAQ